MKNKLIELAKNEGIDIEISEITSEKMDIETLNGNLKLFQMSNVATYNIKALMNNRVAFLTTDHIEDPEKIITSLKIIFDVQENNNENRLCEGTIINREDTLENIDYIKVKEDLLNLDDLRKEYSEVYSIELLYAHYSDKYAINSFKSDMLDEVNFHEYVAEIVVKKDDITRVVFVSHFSKNYNIEEFKKIIIAKIENAIIKINSKSLKTNKYNIIIKNSEVANILENFAASFQSKDIYLKNSVFTDKLNQKMFSDKINIAEDPEHGISARYFDSEGTKTKYKEIVKNGVFLKTINNIEYALKLNEEATGNAYGVRNLYIKSGNDSYEDLIKKLDNGIIIDSLVGFHSGTDLHTGNMSLQAEGLLVENGKIVRGINDIILATNIFEVFSNVLAVGSDMSSSDYCISAPSLLLENITVTGKE